MKEIISYQAIDGTIFATKEECVVYEEQATTLEELKKIKRYCETLEGCSKCFYEKICSRYFDGSPSSWEF